MSYFDRLNIRFGKRTPLILQTEAAECGLASIAMIAAYYGQHHSMPSLRARFGSSIKGVTLKKVISVVDSLGFNSRPLRLELNELSNLRLPCILHWDLDHFVVLNEVHNDKVVILDPADGKRVLSISETSHHFTGVALELTPSIDFSQNEKPARIKLSQLFGHFIGVKRTFLYLIGMAFLVEILGLISPLYVSLVVDEAIVSANYQLLNILVFGFSIILFINIGVSWLRHWSLLGLNAVISAQASENILAHLINLPVSFFEARHQGDILARLGSQDTILNALTEDFIEALLDGFMVIITLIVMALISPLLTMLAIIAAVIYALIRWISYSPIRQAEMEGIVWSARAESHLLETLRGVRSVKLNNAHALRRIQWVNLNVEAINRGLSVGKISLFVESANKFVIGLLSLFTVWLAAQLILTDKMSIGLLLAYLSYSSMFLSRISKLIDAMVQLKMLGLHAERIADIALAEPEPTPEVFEDTKVSSSTPLSIELKNVSYQYTFDEPFVLDKINLKIQPGEWLAITGPSGSGKSTLLKILSGQVKPTQGEVLINGEPLDYFGISKFRNRVGVVLQDDHLFTGSIQDNISFFVDNANQKQVEVCAKLASVYDEIMNFPMRFGTSVGDMGTVLSGGQKQRVLLARALYKNPEFLLLDEATSHLDVENEREINTSMSDLSMTRIVIAHRPETIKSAQRIIELVDGKIIVTAHPVAEVSLHDKAN